MPLIAVFTLKQPPPRTYLFDASASSDTGGTIVRYIWDFGDGQTGSGMFVAHTFPRGQFTIKLTVIDDTGNQRSTTQDLTITNIPPTYSFAFEPALGGLPRAVTFDASSAYDPDGTIVSYDWDFDSGRIKSSGVRVTQLFELGPHRLSLRVTDNDGGYAETPLGFLIVDFSLVAASGGPPRAVTFDASACDPFVNCYYWVFGDGQTGTGARVTHTYPVGNYTVTLYAFSFLGGGGHASRTFTIDNQSILPDPITVAPTINQTVATTLAGASAFLYTGDIPIQTGVAANTIDRRRAAVLRGVVTDRDGTPLWNVQVSVLGHPEFGQTHTRGDGRFDLAVNGGKLFTMSYTKAGYLPVHQQAQARWQGYSELPPVVLLPLDDTVTTIDLMASAAMQVARGSVHTDSHGTRQATLFFPKGTQATLVRPDGTELALPTLTVRATEYTVGESGPAAMPAPLPLTSWYTYAVEFSADEALAVGATTVRFNQPLIYYLENFLNFSLNKGSKDDPIWVPVGVPAGSYSREQAAWLPSQDGRVIKILGVAAGLAVLDTMGDGKTDTGAALGITDAERQQLAALYQVGQSLWRVPIMHFTPEDLNWPMSLPKDAQPPNQPNPQYGRTIPDPCLRQGSTIECQNQTLGEAVGIAGTPFSLHYKSDRVRGRSVENALLVSLSGDSVPNSLQRIALEIAVAGQHFAQSFPAQPKQSYTYTWDGRDAYGRPMQGRQTAMVRIGYVYSCNYTEPSRTQGPGGMVVSFAQPSNSAIELTGNAARLELTIWQVWHLPLGAWDSLAQGLGAWTLSVHHTYDPTHGVLYLGNGQRYSTEVFDLATIATVAGGGHNVANLGDGGPATSATLALPWAVAVGPDGSLYIADHDNACVRRVSPDGIITTVAGRGSPKNGNGDGGPATAALLYGPMGVAVGLDESLYIVDNALIRLVGTDGIITTVAGGGSPKNGNGDGGPATAAAVVPLGVAVAPDESLYIADNQRIRRVGPDGIITTVAGGGQNWNGDNGPATQAILNQAEGVAVGPDGSLYIQEFLRIRRVGPDGIITTVAGNGTQGGSGDGGPATQAQFNQLQGVAVGPDGSFYITDWGSLANRVRQVSPDGIITTIVGIGLSGYSGDGGPATAAQLNHPVGVAIGPDNHLYIADNMNQRVRRVAPVFPELSLSEFLIPSEDGTEAYLFDGDGRHQSTQDALTGTLRYQFTYDGAGRLTSVKDGNNNVTTIRYEANPPVIVGPYGHRTTLAWDANGYLADITNPANESVQCVYSPDGLLSTLTDPKNNVYHFYYEDATGRLWRDEDPAGGKQDLTRQDQGSAYTVTLDTVVTLDPVLKNEYGYVVEYLSTGDVRYTNSCCSGLQTVSTKKCDGTTTTTTPDGTVTQQVLGPDPRWGMQAPLSKSLTITTPGNGNPSLTLQVNKERTVTLADPNNPLSLTGMTDTVTVNGQKHVTTYTAATKTRITTTPVGRQATTMLDVQGRLAQQQVANLFPMGYTYDANGRLSTIAHGTGVDTRTVSLSYGNDGYLSKLTDPLGRTASFTYDKAGRLTAQTLADGSVIGSTFDANGNLVTITTPVGQAHTFAYTPVNLLSAYTWPKVGNENNQTQYTYNLDRRLTRITRPDGQTVDFGYDAVAGRLSTLTTPQGQTVYTYDAMKGTLTTIAAPGGITLTYGYDGVLLLSESWSGPITGSVSRTYDNAFRITSRNANVNGDTIITYQYDNDGLLTQAGSLVLNRDAQNGMLAGTTLGDVTDTWSYDSFGELTGYSAAFQGKVLYDLQYTRDALGRITQKTETIGVTTDTYTYSYDLAGRLTQVTRKDGAGNVSTASYAYDSNGNRSSYLDASGAINGTYDVQDRLKQYGSTMYTYTANGELQSKTVGGQTTQYVYNVLGNLVSVTLSDGTQITYLVDGQNRRIGKQVNGVLVQGFLYQDSLRPIAELDGANKLVSRFVYAGRSNVPDYLIKGGTTYRIVTDHLGGPRLVVDITTGTIVQRMDYDAFGRVLNDTNPGFQPFSFAGGLYDRDTKLIRFGARDYDAEMGRWAAKDPIKFDGGSTNLYAYVFDDPINRSDPLGWFTIDVNFQLNPFEFLDAPEVPFGINFGILISEGRVYPNAGLGVLSSSGFSIQWSDSDPEIGPAFEVSGGAGACLSFGLSTGEHVGSPESWYWETGVTTPGFSIMFNNVFSPIGENALQRYERIMRDSDLDRSMHEYPGSQYNHN